MPSNPAYLFLSNRSFPRMIMAVIFFFSGVTVLAISYQDVRDMISSRSWERKIGIVRQTEVIDKSFGQRVFRFLPIVHYEYEYQGTRYQANRIDYMRDAIAAYSTAEEAKTALKPYFTGKQVVVYVNPNFPAYSMLEPQKYPLIILLCITSASLIAFGLFYFRLAQFL